MMDKPGYKERHRAYSREWYKKNAKRLAAIYKAKPPEVKFKWKKSERGKAHIKKYIAAARERYRSDPEYRKIIRDQAKAWRQANLDKVRERAKVCSAKYYKANRESILVRRRAWYASLTPEHKKALNRQGRRANG